MGRIKQVRGTGREVKKGRVYKFNRLIREVFTLKAHLGK